MGLSCKQALMTAGIVSMSISSADAGSNTRESYYVTAGTIQSMCASEAKPLVKVFASAIVDTHRTYVEAKRIPKKICAPVTVTADELAEAVCSYAAEHPEMAPNSGAQVAIISLATKWPGKK